MGDSKPIILLTPAMAHHIKPMIDQKPNCIGFRISVKKGGCTGFSYELELPEIMNETDLHWENEYGFRVFVEAKSVEMIRGTELDFEDKGMGQAQVRFKNPNIKQACGCGESFSVE